jgi:hypothetical protein
VILDSPTVQNSQASKDVFQMRTGCTGQIGTLSGTNAGALLPLRTISNVVVRLLQQPTITGGTGGSEVLIGANAATTWANAFAGATALCTDFGATSSQGCRVGP